MFFQTKVLQQALLQTPPFFAVRSEMGCSSALQKPLAPSASPFVVDVLEASACEISLTVAPTKFNIADGNWVLPSWKYYQFSNKFPRYTSIKGSGLLNYSGEIAWVCYEISRHLSEIHQIHIKLNIS